MTRAWREDLVGMRFERLLVIDASITESGHRRWICKCDCGNKKVIAHSQLKNNITRSCGCLRAETARARMSKHGQAQRGKKSRLYKIWLGMVSRCTIPSATGFGRYGGAGISVCERWRVFEYFAADMGEPLPEYSLDRIDSTGSYEPSNCRWSSRQTQNENRRSVRWIEFEGKRMNVTQWAGHLGINKSTLFEALSKHPIEYALRSRRTGND